MKFKKTYKIFDTGYQRNIYYYINDKRVSSEKYYEYEYKCQQLGMKYNSSALYIDDKIGRTIAIHHYN